MSARRPTITCTLVLLYSHAARLQFYHCVTPCREGYGCNWIIGYMGSGVRVKYMGWEKHIHCLVFTSGLCHPLQMQPDPPAVSIQHFLLLKKMLVLCFKCCRVISTGQAFYFPIWTIWITQTHIIMCNVTNYNAFYKMVMARQIIDILKINFAHQFHLHCISKIIG